jgi:hypothetical protein
MWIGATATKADSDSDPDENAIVEAEFPFNKGIFDSAPYAQLEYNGVALWPCLLEHPQTLSVNCILK